MKRLAIFTALIFALAAGALASAQSARAQEITPTQAEATIQRLENVMAATSTRADAADLSRDDIRFIRRQIGDLIKEASAFREAALGRAGRFQTLLDALGPPPGEGELPEAPDIEERRNDLKKQIADSKARSKRAGLLIARAELLLREVTKTSRQELADRLLQFRASPFDIRVWQTALSEFSSAATTAFVKAPIAWAKEQAKAENVRSFLTKIIGLAMVVSLIALPARRWLVRRYGRTNRVAEPSYRRRALAGLVEGVAHGLFPMAFVAMALAAMQRSLQLNATFEIVFEAAAINLLIFFFVWGLINGLLPRDGGNWHVTTLSERSARMLAWRLKTVMLIFVGFRGTLEAFAWHDWSAELETAFNFAYALALYPALATLSARGLWQTVRDSEDDGVSAEDLGQLPQADEPLLSGGLRRTFAAVLLAIPVSAILGYANLSWFLAEGVVLTGIVASVALMLRWLKNELVEHLFDPTTAMGRRTRHVLGLSDTDVSRSLFLGKLLLDLLLLTGALILLLPVWGFGGDETLIWMSKAFRGIQIGSVTLSLFDLLVATGLFVAILAATRLVQRNLDSRVLSKMTSDVGVRNALKTGISYTGFVIAALAAIAAVGIDLSNLALVLGALSVGIGFGLQNVVNNFVSGLILLIERPIKEGDWVVIGGNEGMVKSVNVRSTEIETFQRASVIIPNADLIATPVTNWTHKNVQGRVEIPVGVAYGSDVEKVKEILLEIGSAHPKVMKTPKPQVIFKDFGASSLDFELRCFLSDVLWVVLAASDIRFAIDKAFREAGIEIPFPQRVVHMAKPAQPSQDNG